MQEILRLRTRRKFEVVDLTPEVAAVAERSRVAEGVREHDRVDDKEGRLLLGTWQGIALVECDGPRDREIIVDVR